jgi:hypothetical protein
MKNYLRESIRGLLERGRSPSFFAPFKYVVDVALSIMVDCTNKL